MEKVELDVMNLFKTEMRLAMDKRVAVCSIAILLYCYSSTNKPVPFRKKLGIRASENELCFVSEHIGKFTSTKRSFDG
jgi:hypothetical protein